MRPMKLAGSELVFGVGSLDYIRNIPERRIFIVTSGGSMVRNGTLEKVEKLFRENNAQCSVFMNVEPDPSFATIRKGADEMIDRRPDLIVGLGGGSAMDAAKAMWIYYEHPELKSLEDLLRASPFPKLRRKARCLCIPSTAGTASEVSRSVVITDDQKGLKHGIGNMEMMPDIAICDPSVTVSMPKAITAETGMDALTHALEALASNRANFLSDLLAEKAASEIISYLPIAFENGEDLTAREKMLNASMIAGMAFTNVSLGIVHSIAHTLGGYFKVPHGKADAILLPYVIAFNRRNPAADRIYRQFSEKIGRSSLENIVRELNRKLGIPERLSEAIEDEERFMKLLPEMAAVAKNDGCTKTNPIIPTESEFIELMKICYDGDKG